MENIHFPSSISRSYSKEGHSRHLLQIHKYSHIIKFQQHILLKQIVFPDPLPSVPKGH